MFLRIRSGNSREKLQQLADEELISSYKNTKDREFIGTLFERYTHLVFGVCLKHLKDEEKSKDATMEIFELLYEKLLEFEITSFKGWIHTVSRNHCLMKLRKEKTDRKHRQDIYETSKHEVMESGDFFHLLDGNPREDKLSRLDKAIDQLKEEQKKCIELLYLQQKSYREVSEITGYDMKKVKSYIQNGKRNLKIILENK